MSVCDPCVVRTSICSLLPVHRRPLCRFKSCPSEPANSSCSIFIKPLSLKEPYPDHGKSHSSRSRSHARSILALVPLLPVLLSLSLSPPFTSLALCPSPCTLPPWLSLSIIHTFTYIHSGAHFLSLSPTHIYINTHNTHMVTHPLNPSESNIPAQAGGSGAGGAFRQRCLWGARLSFGKKRVSIVFCFLFLSFLEC